MQKLELIQFNKLEIKINYVSDPSFPPFCRSQTLPHFRGHDLGGTSKRPCKCFIRGGNFEILRLQRGRYIYCIYIYIVVAACESGETPDLAGKWLRLSGLSSGVEVGMWGLSPLLVDANHLLIDPRAGNWNPCTT